MATLIRLALVGAWATTGACSLHLLSASWYSYAALVLGATMGVLDAFQEQP